MDKISISEVSKRRRSLSNKKKRKDISLLLNKDKLTLKEAQEVIENFESISNDQIYAFEQVLEIFKESYSNGYTCKNDLELQRLCNTICGVMPRLETVDNPIRDKIMLQTREVRNFAKRALRNAKTYANRAIDPYDGSISDKTYNNRKKKDKDIPDDYIVKTLKDLPTKDSFNISLGGGSSPSAGKVEECYNQMQETVRMISICDRVLYNHEKMSKRFNLNEVVEESKDFELCVYELCNLIDSYDMPFDIKYNVALENILYLFELNKKYVDENPKEYIDEFFYTKDISPQNLLFMESITDENPFYLENDKSIVESTTNEFSYFIESSKENPVKNLIEDFKKEDNKSAAKIKMVINKIYTKSPQQIIDGTPNFLAWIRNLLLLSTFGFNPVIGCLTIFTDKMISMHLKRKEIEKVLNSYDSEMKKVKSKIEKAKSEETKENLTKYYDKLESERKKLKEYRDSLRSEKELDSEWEDEFDFDFDESACLAEGIFDKITIGEELDVAKERIRFEFKRVLERLKIASNNKFKKYFDKGLFRFVPQEEIEEFLNFDEELGRYLDASGNICMSFCYCNFEKLFEEDDTTDYFKIIQELCDFCAIGAAEKVSISYEGTGGNMYLIFTYLEPLYIESDLRDEVRESYFHPMSYGSLGTIYSISEYVDVFNDYTKEEFINNINEAYFNSLEVKTMINYLNNSSLFSIDESIDILMTIRNNSTDIESQNIKYLVDNYIKESVNIQEKEFNLLSYKEDVEMYIAVSEALNDKVKKDSKELSKKAGVKKDSLSDKSKSLGSRAGAKTDSIKDKVSKSASSAAITAKLGAQSAAKGAKDLDAKQQKLSKDMDDMVSSLTRRIEQAAVTKNREQIIKGSVLPSASKIVKMAVGFGGAYLVNPAIAVIGSLSMLFMSKNATKKERALILDEIDIELRIVEKKIARAESEDDDDALRDLYKIQNKLVREKQRLKYRMNVYYHQKPTAGGSSKERIDN